MPNALIPTHSDENRRWSKIREFVNTAWSISRYFKEISNGRLNYRSATTHISHMSATEKPEIQQSVCRGFHSYETVVLN